MRKTHLSLFMFFAACAVEPGFANDEQPSTGDEQIVTKDGTQTPLFGDQVAPVPANKVFITGRVKWANGQVGTFAGDVIVTVTDGAGNVLGFATVTLNADGTFGPLYLPSGAGGFTVNVYPGQNGITFTPQNGQPTPIGNAPGFPSSTQFPAGTPEADVAVTLE